MGIKNNSVNVEETAWTDLAVIICSKCQALFKGNELVMSGDVSDQIKGLYKKRLKDEGLSEKCRVMVSGCQSICLDNRQAMTFFSNLPAGANSKTKNSTTTITMHPDHDIENVYQMILEHLNEKL